MSLLKSINIGKVITSNNVFVAPMAGITDISFRTIAKRFGAGLLFTEMVSSYATVFKNKETERISEITEEERPVGIQLFGSDPDIMKRAAGIICNKYKPDIIDINAGCPVPKVLKSGSGSKLLEDPNRLFKIVKAIVETVEVPVTVKMRLGIDKNRINVVENSLAVQNAGAKLVTLHPRTAKDKFNGVCQWEYIALIKEKLSIPVCGNGDIKSFHDAIKMIKETGCDAVMVGRGTIGNPWLIKDIVTAFSMYPETYYTNHVGINEKISVSLEHLNHCCRIKGEERGIRELRRILPRYIKGIDNSARIRNMIVRARSYTEIETILQSILSVDSIKD